MEEDVKKVKKSVRNSSKVRKKTELSSEELLEQIMNKKKAKKDSTSKENKITSKTPVLEKVEKKTLTDEELLESILNKKKDKKIKKSTSSKSTTSTKVRKTTSAKSIASPKTKNSVVNKDVENSDVINKPKKVNARKSEKQQSDVLPEAFNDNNEIIDSNDKLEDSSTKTEDLIITREIRFDDVDLNLNNKRVLKELRKAIEDFDNLEDLEEINSSLDLINDGNGADGESNVPETVFVNQADDSDDYLAGTFAMPQPKKKQKDKVKYDNNEGQKLLLILICLLLACVLIFIIMHFITKDGYAQNISEDDPLITEVLENDDSSIKEIAYNECLKRKKDVNDINDKYMNAKQELSTYLSENYKTSVAYLDLTTGFDYSYEPSQYTEYYAASTTKTLAALYIYIKAAAGEINLDDTMVYSSKYSYSASKGMKTHKYGDKVSLRVLVSYAIIYSDNSAYRMLLDYIGRNEIEDFYEKNYNIYVNFPYDDFGNIFIERGLEYMTLLNDFINNNGDLGKELQSFFLEAEQNDLAIPEEGIAAAHKYGQYQQYYHDIGIVYDEYPYIVVILTLEGRGNFEEKVKDISHHVYNLHKIFYENRQEICNAEVYGM